MGITFTQYFPNFVTGFDPEIKELTSIEDAFNTKTCKRWAEGKDFLEFKLLPHGTRTMIMAVMKDGKTWGVGFLLMREDN